MTSRAMGAQERAYQYIQSYVQAHHGQSPTLCEIGKAIGMPSKSQITYVLQGLERRGLIERPSHVSRGIRLSGFAVAQVTQTGQGALLVRVLHEGRTYSGRVQIEEGSAL